MGDMADYALDQVDYAEELLLDYHTGRVSDSEAYDAGIIDELGFEIWSGRNDVSVRNSAKSQRKALKKFLLRKGNDNG